MIMAQLDKAKPKIEAMLNQMPHQEATVDGVGVAVFEQKGYGRGDEQLSPDQFVGIAHDATPVGAGIQGPAGGKWDSAIVKFSDWTKGAGTIDEESFVSMSATELLQSQHANRTLWTFDQLLSQLMASEPLSNALAFIPAKPSEVFASAAKFENINVGASKLDENARVTSSSTSALVTMAMAAVGGVAGAGFVLALSKSRSATRDYALLS